MSGYVYKGAGSRLGLFATLELQRENERLRALFAAGVPIIASSDGLSFTVHGKRPPPDDDPEEDD